MKQNQWQELTGKTTTDHERLGLKMMCAKCHRYHKDNNDFCIEECVFYDMSEKEAINILAKHLNANTIEIKEAIKELTQ